MPKTRSKRSKKRSFHGNRFTESDDVSASTSNVTTASTAKLNLDCSSYVDILKTDINNNLTGNRIIDLSVLFNIFSVLCCPDCFYNGLHLSEDSKFGLCSNFVLKCRNCPFMKGFSSTPKTNKNNSINTFIVFGLRLIGCGYTAGKKLCSTLCLPFLSKCSFRHQEKILLNTVESCAQLNLNSAAKEVRDMKKANNREIISCGVSVDGTWQRRGYSSLNGCVSAISIDTGKILDIEILSQYCRVCQTKISRCTNSSKTHICSNHKGSAGNMEVVGAYRIVERSESLRQLVYSEYYGDGDFKGFDSVKDIYGENSVKKLECIGHVQKRVGGHLRKLKKNTKWLSGKGKLTDKFIDRLQNYYGIAIRCNVGNLEKMQSAVIASFFHCCSGTNSPMHRQCPEGPNSWCKFQRARFSGVELQEKKPGLSSTIINKIKGSYMELCDQKLLQKGLHGKTQNCNESFNGVLWNVVPKETFVELQTLRLGTYIAVLIYNSGYTGLLPVFEKLGVPIEPEQVKGFINIDDNRIADSIQHSSVSVKLSRKKRRTSRKNKSVKDDIKEGPTYKAGEF